MAVLAATALCAFEDAEDRNEGYRLFVFWWPRAGVFEGRCERLVRREEEEAPLNALGTGDDVFPKVTDSLND